MSDRTYTQHENGHNDFARHAGAYARAFGVNINWLLTGVGSPTGTRSPADDLYEALNPTDRAKWIEYGELLRGRTER